MSTKNFVSYGDAETLFTGVGNKLSSLNSNLTSVEEWVDADAKTVTGNPITLTDAANVNAKALSMTVEPIQDLHGYDHPWVGGAGKNKKNITDKSGTAPGYIATTQTMVLSAGTYTFSFDVDAISTGAAVDIILQDENNNVLVSGGTTLVVGRNSITLTLSTASVKWSVYANNSVSANYTKWMIEEGSPATDYAPYENICPITGHTEASVQRDGKNLCFRGEGNIYNGGSLIPVNVGDKIYCYGKWTSSSTTNMYGAVFDTANRSDKNTGRLEKFSNFQSGNISVCTVSQKGYFGVCFNSAASDYEVQEMMISRTPITSASDYEPYQGKTYTISLGDTIYGGTINFNTGVCTVTHSIFDLGEQTWTATSVDGNACFYTTISDKKSSADGKCSHFAYSPRVASDNTFSTSLGSNTQVYVRDETYNNPSDFKTAMSGVKMTYKLATPTTLQLTPAQLELLKGNNTVSANGATISLTYQPDNLVGEVMEQVDDIVDPIETRLETAESDLASKIGKSNGLVCYPFTVVQGTTGSQYQLNITGASFGNSRYPIMILYSDNTMTKNGVVYGNVSSEGVIKLETSDVITYNAETHTFTANLVTNSYCAPLLITYGLAITN